MASSSRNRDIGRSYKTGHEKRKKKAVEEDWQREDISPKLQNSSLDQGEGWNLQMIYEYSLYVIPFRVDCTVLYHSLGNGYPT